MVSVVNKMILAFVRYGPRSSLTTVMQLLSITPLVNIITKIRITNILFNRDPGVVGSGLVFPHLA